MYVWKLLMHTITSIMHISPWGCWRGSHIANVDAVKWMLIAWLPTLMPWSHQIESALYVGELVFHKDFHDGPSPSTYTTTLKMVITCTLTSRFGHTRPTTKSLWIVHVAQLCCHATVFSHWGDKATKRVVVHYNKMLSKPRCWCDWSIDLCVGYIFKIEVMITMYRHFARLTKDNIKSSCF